jgi:chromosome segregation ATPase
MDDFKTERNACQAAVSTLNTEITQITQAVSKLEQEKAELQRLVRKYQSNVSSRRSTHLIHRQQISEADRAKGEIAALKSHAASTKANVLEAVPELHNIKMNLDQCSTLVKEKSLDVSTSSDFVERWADWTPVFGESIRRSREFRRQRQLIEQVSETLERIHTEVPQLLQSSQRKFLNIQPWDAEEVNLYRGDPIPEVSLR